MLPLKQAVYSSRTADKFVVRLPDGLRENIAGLAKDRRQSMNSYIIARLERAVAADLSGEAHTRYTPTIGMLVEHKSSLSVATLSQVVFVAGHLHATLNYVLMNEGCPAAGVPVLLSDLRPYVV
jgi:hypothetical protein